MEKDGLLNSEERNVNGKIRKYYKITPLGDEVLKSVKIQNKRIIKRSEVEGGFL